MKVSQKIRVTKEFGFEMAHALYGHDGLCGNIHGHSYKLSVTLIGVPLNEYSNPKDGMVMDFSDLKKVVQREVLDVFDHALVLNASSPHSELNELKQNFEKVIRFGGQPTCENLVSYFAKRISKSLPVGIILHHVRLQETPTSIAEWYFSDNC